MLVRDVREEEPTIVVNLSELVGDHVTVQYVAAAAGPYRTPENRSATGISRCTNLALIRTPQTRHCGR